MCVKPNIIDGLEVSCRECDKCVATYKNTWVARCCAELATVEHALCFTLTYADVFGEPPLGARVFRYKDVQDWLKRVRRRANLKWGVNIELRYVIVGERGSQNNRCHYHGVVFSSHPIHTLGEMTGATSKGFAYKRRLDWDVWGHGFVEFQLADRDGIGYALKYILKSRMTAEKSKGTGREGKTEWLASSYMWCSKAPPVGATWLVNQLHEKLSVGLSPSSLRMRVPGGGDWYINGPAQEIMCLWLHEANNKFRQERGRDLAGWQTLLHSVSKPIENVNTGELTNRKAWEWLTNGEEDTQNDEDDGYEETRFEAFKKQYKRKQEVAAAHERDKATVANCGNVAPCYDCQNYLDPAQLADVQQEEALLRDEYEARYFRDDDEDKEGFASWWRTRLRPSRGCRKRNEPETVAAFERCIPIYRASRDKRGRAAIGKTLQRSSR